MIARAPAIIAALVLLAIAPAARAQAPAAQLTDAQRRSILDEAQAAYEQGVATLRNDPIRARESFRTAADRFELLVDEGIDNGRLYYDLANAYLQADELGLAILNYRRAQHYIPGDERLESNLSYARSLVRSRIAPAGQRELLDALLIWHRHTATRSRFLAFALVYGLFWLVVMVRLFDRRPAWKYPAAVLAVLWLALGVSVTVDVLRPGAVDQGVVLADDVIVRKGNGDGFEPQFAEPLYQGVEFSRLEQRADWLRIRLPDSSTGWIRTDQAAMIESAAAAT